MLSPWLPLIFFYPVWSDISYDLQADSLTPKPPSSSRCSEIFPSENSHLLPALHFFLFFHLRIIILFVCRSNSIYFLKRRVFASDIPYLCTYIQLFVCDIQKYIVTYIFCRKHTQNSDKLIHTCSMGAMTSIIASKRIRCTFYCI